MARGKNAILAARRRYEASLDVVDRLADKNAELKSRTKTVEAAAASAPTLRARIAELERQIAESVTPAMTAERGQHLAIVDELTKKLSLACGMVELLVDTNGHLDDVLIPVSCIEQADYLGLVFRNKRMAPSRGYRRAQEFRHTAGDRNELFEQDDALGKRSAEPAFKRAGRSYRAKALDLVRESSAHSATTEAS